MQEIVTQSQVQGLAAALTGSFAMSSTVTVAPSALSDRASRAEFNVNTSDSGKVTTVVVDLITGFAGAGGGAPCLARAQIYQIG